jgi:TPR repeat protein
MENSPVNPTELDSSLKRAADEGGAVPQYNSGNCRQDGKGISQDLEGVAHYFKLAADSLFSGSRAD